MLHKTIDVNAAFSNFPNELYWYFLIDLIWWHKGKYVFDDERSPNYLNRATIGLYYTLTTIDKELDVNLIIGLHDVTFHEQTARNKLGIYPSYVRSGLSLVQTTEAGLTELIRKIRVDGYPIDVYLYDPNEPYPLHQPDKSIFLNQHLSPQKLAKYTLKKMTEDNTSLRIVRLSNINKTYFLMKFLIKRYHEEIRRASCQKHIYQAIVRFVQDMHQVHPFGDGNGRVFIFLILLKLLLMNKLDPCFIDIPGKFSGHSVDELINLIKKGQKLFREICKECSCRNKTSFLDFLSKSFTVNTPEETLNIFFIDWEGTLNRYEEDQSYQLYVKQHLDFIYAHYPLPRSSSLLKNLFKTIPPTGQFLPTLLIKSLEESNFALFNIVINSAPPSLIAKVKLAAQSGYEGPITMLPKILLHPKFEWKAHEIVLMLTMKSDKEKHILRYLLNADISSQQLKILLSQLDKPAILNLFSYSFDTLNGLQLICIYAKTSILQYALSTIPTALQLKLLKQNKLEGADLLAWDEKKLDTLINMLEKEQNYLQEKNSSLFFSPNSAEVEQKPNQDLMRRFEP